MATISGALSNTSTKSFVSEKITEEEFYQKYTWGVSDGIISITEKTDQIVRARLETKQNEQQYEDDSNPTHFHNGIFYFVLSSEKYTKAKYVYSFDPSQKNNSIKCIIGCLQNPNFKEHLLVEFGLGFTTHGPQNYNYDGWGVIKIYDLDRAQGSREIKKYILENGSSGGWDGSIEENNEIHAFDHVRGETRIFELPLAKKV